MKKLNILSGIIYERKCGQNNVFIEKNAKSRIFLFKYINV